MDHYRQWISWISLLSRDRSWIHSQLWYLWSGALSHWVLVRKEMDLCWEVANTVADTKPCENWSSLWPRSNSSLLFMWSRLSSLPRGQCTDVMPLSVRACAIRSSFLALHWPLKQWYTKSILLKRTRYKTWNAKHTLLLISKLIYHSFESLQLSIRSPSVL